MAGITLETAEEHLSIWLEADRIVATGQSYTIKGRQLTRANTAEIKSNIEYWDKYAKRLSRGGVKVRFVVPVSEINR